MKKLSMLKLTALLMLIASSWAVAKEGTTNGRWCNKLDGDFAGDCGGTVHCAPGWGLEPGTCEYAVDGVYVGGKLKSKKLLQKDVKTKQEMSKKTKLKAKSKPGSK